MLFFLKSLFFSYKHVINVIIFMCFVYVRLYLLYSPLLHIIFVIKVLSFCLRCHLLVHLGRAKRIWYLSPMRAAKVQASLRIRAVSPEPSLLAHTSSESRGTFRRKARSLAPLNGWACAVKVCHDGMLEDTNSLDSAHLMSDISQRWKIAEPFLSCSPRSVINRSCYLENTVALYSEKDKKGIWR